MSTKMSTKMSTNMSTKRRAPASGSTERAEKRGKADLKQKAKDGMEKMGYYPGISCGTLEDYNVKWDLKAVKWLSGNYHKRTEDLLCKLGKLHEELKELHH